MVYLNCIMSGFFPRAATCPSRAENLQLAVGVKVGGTIFLFRPSSHAMSRLADFWDIMADLTGDGIVVQCDSDLGPSDLRTFLNDHFDVVNCQEQRNRSRQQPRTRHRHPVPYIEPWNQQREACEVYGGRQAN
jgi:hypothetical protein